MSFNIAGECRNTGRTHFLKGIVPWNKGLHGIKRINPVSEKIDKRKFGHPHTEETKKKISIGCEGISPWNKGKKLSKLHRERISANHHKTTEWCYERWMVEIPKIIVTAIKHELAGISEPYNNHSWRKLRKRIYERDCFVCQECLKKCDNTIGISCHHIDFDRSNNNLSNLITLCSSCHGKTTQSPDEWIQYYQDKMLLKTRR